MKIAFVLNPDFTALDHLAAGMRSRAVDEV